VTIAVGRNARSSEGASVLALRRVSQDTYPVQLSEAKEHLRVDGDENDRYIVSLIAAASELIQARTGRALTLATYELVVEELPPGPVSLPVPPVYRPAPQATVQIENPDGGAALTPTLLLNLDDELWPTAGPASGEWPARGRAVFSWRAGYGSAADVPPQIRHAILMVIAALFDDRSGTSLNPGSPRAVAVDALLASVSTGFLAGGRDAYDRGLDGNDLWVGCSRRVTSPHGPSA
jgi:uncharacterized phiE125 gp8 family phage protein